MAGDADTTGAMCGQIAGAFYGHEQLNPAWVQDLNCWDKREIELRAILLYVEGLREAPNTLHSLPSQAVERDTTGSTPPVYAPCPLHAVERDAVEHRPPGSSPPAALGSTPSGSALATLGLPSERPSGSALETAPGSTPSAES